MINADPHANPLRGYHADPNMFIAIIVLGFFLFVIIALLLFLFDGFFGGVDFTSSSLVVKQVIKIIEQENLENGNFYDLGSCRGGFAINMAESLPNFKVTGIDDSLFRTLLAKSRSVFLNNISFKKENIFNANISSANVIYLYLPQELMPDLQSKLQKELKSGSLVISASVSFPSWQPTKVYDLDDKGLKRPKIFVYKKF